jgi:hypothetical protein
VKTGRGVTTRTLVVADQFNLYSEYLTKKSLEGSGDFKIGQGTPRNVKYAGDLLLLSKVETVLQGVIDRIN